MKKSSNVKSFRVNEEKIKKSANVELDLKSLDLKEVIRMGLQDFMFEAGSWRFRRHWLQR